MNPKPQDIMQVEEIAQDLVNLCSQGRFSEAIEKHYAKEIVSKELTEEAVGLETVRANDRLWQAEHEIHGLTVEGPFLGLNKFAVRFICDVTSKPEARRFTLDELSLYTISDGKIVLEQIFCDKEE